MLWRVTCDDINSTAPLASVHMPMHFFPGQTFRSVQLLAIWISPLHDIRDLTRACKAWRFKAQLGAASRWKVNRNASPLRSAWTHVMVVLASLKHAVTAMRILFIDHAENVTPGPVTAVSFHSTVTVLICIYVYCICMYIWILICMCICYIYVYVYVYYICMCMCLWIWMWTWIWICIQDDRDNKCM